MNRHSIPNSTARRKSERGSTLILATFAMLAIVGFMGLAFDSSYMFYYKRRMQTAADAGAIAGAQELLRNNASEVTLAARKDTSLNRFTHGVRSTAVTVNSPPVSGARAGQSGFVEVIVSQPQPTWFLKALQLDSATIRARAVAGVTAADGCVYALNRDGSNVNNGFFANGTTDSIFACGVYSNSNFRAVGGGCVVTPSVSYTATYSNSNNSDPNCGPEGVGQGTPAADPLLNLGYGVPAYGGCDYNNYKRTSGGAVTLSPGVYCGGIEIGGSVPSATFLPGSYTLVGGGMKISSGANASGTGVTFFNTYPGTQVSKYDGITINTSGTVSFTAPVSGANRALLFHQDPRVSWASNNGSTITAGSNSWFQGILYFPSTDLTYAGNSSSSNSSDGYTFLVGYNIKVAGNSRVNADYSSIGGFSPFQKAVFVE